MLDDPTVLPSCLSNQSSEAEFESVEKNLIPCGESKKS